MQIDWGPRRALTDQPKKTSSCCGQRGDNVADDSRRRTFGYVLDVFRRTGRAPTHAEIATALQVADKGVTDDLRALEDAGALRLDPDGSAILDAYPYSAVPTKHTVRLSDGPLLHCMCAIDVFYVPFLTESDVRIESHCHYCEAGIRLAVHNGTLAGVDPPAIVVWDSAAAYDCPMTNFFCSEEHLRLWRESAPGEQGQQIDLFAALDRGRIAAARIRRALAEPRSTGCSNGLDELR
jgi:hypothetical protein